MRQTLKNPVGTRRVLANGWFGLFWVAAAGAAAAQSYAALMRPRHNRLDDLQMYYGSVGGLVSGGSLYDYTFPPTGAPFTYPPFAGLLLQPIARFDLDVLMVGWTLATVLAVVSLAFVVARAAASIPETLTTAQYVSVVALLFFLSSPISSNLRFGQISVFVVLAVLFDCLRVVPARFTGVATGIAAAVKLTPLIFIPYFWASGQRRAAVTAAGTFTACTGLGWLLLPGDSIRFWVTEIFDVDGMGFVAIGGNQSLNGALLRLGLPHQARIAAVAAIGGTVVLTALVRAARAWRNNQPLAAAAIVGAAGLVFSPVSWIHHQTWLVLAALIPISTRTPRNVAWAGCVAVVMVLPVTSVGALLPGGAVLGNARLILAVAIAAIVPFLAVRGAPDGPTAKRPGSESATARPPAS